MSIILGNIEFDICKIISNNILFYCGLGRNNKIEVNFFGNHGQYYTNIIDNKIDISKHKEENKDYFTFNPLIEIMKSKGDNNIVEIDCFKKKYYNENFHIINNDTYNIYYKWNDKYSLHLNHTLIYGLYSAGNFMIVENENYDYKKQNIDDCKIVFSYFDMRTTYQLGDGYTIIYVDDDNNLCIFNNGDVSSYMYFHMSE